MTTPELQLRTLYVLDDAGRIVRLPQPDGRRPPALTLVRGPASCAWAVRADLDAGIAAQLSRLLADEPPTTEEVEPRHADTYREIVGGDEVFTGPAFVFPDDVGMPSGAVVLDAPHAAARHFAWLLEEFDLRAPIGAVLVDGHAVSLCHSSRWTDEAAEAGLETAESFRGSGYGAIAAAAWASAIQASGRVALYSTAWTNAASRAVVRKLGLELYASDWSVYGSAR